MSLYYFIFNNFLIEENAIGKVDRNTKELLKDQEEIFYGKDDDKKEGNTKVLKIVCEHSMFLINLMVIGKES